MPTGTKKEYLWRPFPKQTSLLICPSFECGYGGAPGGGKSDVMLIDALQGLKHEGYKALIVRRKLSDLERSLIARSHVLYRGRGRWDGQHHRWNFPNNCSIEFGHCLRVHDVHNYDSAEYSFIGFEQLEQFTEDMYLHFFTRVRRTNPEIVKKIRSNFNPGGIGHSWIKRRFKIGEYGSGLVYAFKVKDRLDKPDGSSEEYEYDRAFVPALVYDNEHIMKNDPQYIMGLMQLKEPMRTAYLEGRFDLFEGQFFKEWDEKIHVCKPFEIPNNWDRYISFDWGYKDLTCVLWFAEDSDSGTIYCYREYKVNQTIDIEVAKEISRLSRGESIKYVYYPWDLDNDNPQTGVSMKERMYSVWRGLGDSFYLKEAVKKREQGWNAMRYLLGIRENGQPRLKFFNTCKYLIRTIPEQVHDEVHVEDLDSLGDDHGCDAARYFCASYKNLAEFMAKDQSVKPVLDYDRQLNFNDKRIFPNRKGALNDEDLAMNWDEGEVAQYAFD